MTTIFTCPVCKERLFTQCRTYKCENGHSFDMAKEGYVNLLIGSKSSDFSGDDKQMVSSRTRFLDGGYYSPLREKICNLIKQYGKADSVLVDAGCGEGYYTSAYSEICSHTAGIDISKAAIRHASKKCKNAEFAVASVYHLPVADSSADIIINCFSPNAPDEFSRVLNKGGYLFYVVPSPRHLWELKSILYDVPYENQEKTEEYDGFSLECVEKISFGFTLENGEDIMALFRMTPYAWNTPESGIQRLERTSTLSVTAEFAIHVYKKA